jgi:hypothetical protein
LASFNEDVILSIISWPLLEGTTIITLYYILGYNHSVLMQFEYHLLKGFGSDWHDDDAKIVELWFRDGQAEYIHLLFDIFCVFAFRTGELGLDLSTEQVINHCWLLWNLFAYLVQENVQELLSIVLLVSTEDRDVWINYSFEASRIWLLVLQERFSYLGHTVANWLFSLIKRIFRQEYIKNRCGD